MPVERHGRRNILYVVNGERRVLPLLLNDSEHPHGDEQCLMFTI